MPISRPPLSFRAIEAILLASSSERFLRYKPEKAKAKMDMAIERSGYSEGGRKLQVETRYVVDLFDGKVPEEEKHFVRLETTYQATFEASRDLESQDADMGLLDPTKEVAASLLHTYHVQKLEALGLELIQECIPMPLYWDSKEPADGLE